MSLAAMVIPKRHSETPFEFTREEWADLGDMLPIAAGHFAGEHPDGYTLGWNVGAVAGQHVFHAHLHVIPRFRGELNEGLGIRKLIQVSQRAENI